MTEMSIVGALLGPIGAIVGGVMAYQQGQAAADAAEQQAQAQAAQQNEQARLANEQAGIAQVQAEEEAAKRSRLLSAEIGSSYANWAGNGLSVSGNPDDTFANILNTQVAEGIQDIDTIKDNGALNVWSYQSQANQYKASATNTLIAGQNQASGLRAQGTAALATGIIGGIGSGLSGASSSIGTFNDYGWLSTTKKPTAKV